MQRSRFLPLAVLATLVAAAEIRADYDINPGSPTATIFAGQTITVNFYITPDAVNPSTTFYDYAGEFSLTHTTGTGGGLVFSNTAATPGGGTGDGGQSDAFIVGPTGSTTNNENYAFLGTSSDATPGTTPNAYTNSRVDAFSGGSNNPRLTVLLANDVTTAASPIVLTAGSPGNPGNELLIQFRVHAPTTAVAGDVFRLALDNNQNTSFYSDLGAQENYTANSLAITVAPLPTPEPASLALLGIGGAALALRSIRRRRK